MLQVHPKYGITMSNQPCHHPRKKKVRFELCPNQENKKDKITVEAPLVEHRSVKSSSGHKEKRPVILTNVNLLGQSWPIEITLTDRDMMGFRMLLGIPAEPATDSGLSSGPPKTLPLQYGHKNTNQTKAT